MLLSEVVSITSGYNFRIGTSPDEDGNYSIVQVKDINPSSELEYTQLRKINLNHKLTSPAILKPNDVFISARGVFKAGFVGKTCPDNVVVTSSIYILRVKVDKIIPQFLAIYLNTDQIQKVILKSTSGATLPTAPKSGFEDLFIILPSLERQKEIIQIDKIRQSYTKLIQQKRKLIDSNLQFLIKSKLNI